MKAQLFAGLTTAAVLTSLVATTEVSQAFSISNSYSIAPQLTDILNAPLSIDKFDGAKGKLNSVTLLFKGIIQGNAGFESRDTKPNTVITTLKAAIALTLSDGTPVFDMNPTSETKTSVTAYDRRLDFGGTSGRTFEGLTAEESKQNTYTDTNFLQAFIGSGKLDFLFSANALSNVRGSGNMFSYVDTQAGGDLEVTYDYEEVPEPTTLGMGIVAGLGMWSQRKKVVKNA